jgi:hypothetical protein
MESVFEIDPLTEFFSAIRNRNTKRNYEKDLGRFFHYLKLEGSLTDQARQFAKRAKSDYQWATYQINSYVQVQKERVEKKEITESRIHNLYKPVKIFCEENDIILNWKKLARRLPQRAKAANDRAPELEEIKKILSYPDRRIKSACLIMESSGCRIGAFDYLNWGHIEPIEKKGIVVAAKIKIYAGSNEEYLGFITPECFRVVKEYVKYRNEEGERITKDSPVMRDLIIGDRWGKARPQEVTRLKSTGVKRLVEDALKVMGVREKLAKGKRRHEFQADHGFRKYFKSVCERKMKSLHVEMLLGHTVGLADNYYRPQESELLEEYLKAVPDLTVLERPLSVEPEQVNDLEKEVKGLREEVRGYRALLEETLLELKRYKALKSKDPK